MVCDAGISRHGAQPMSNVRRLNLYVHDEDVTKVRKLAKYLNDQGHRASDAQIIRAALRLAKGDDALLKAFRVVLGTDRRFK